ncbi:MAG: 4-hydroxyphenylacetate 3-hydroxylase N-terminal domain-containing protein [Haloarculaceae archaeon]
MSLRTAAEFEASLRDDRTVYYGSERVADVTDHRALSLSVAHAAGEYDHQFDDEELFAVEDDGEAYSRYYADLDSREALARRRDLVAESTRRHDGVFNCIRAIGSDGIAALLAVTPDVDDAHGTDYEARVRRFRERARSEDLGVSVAMSDVKGDRSKPPGEQADRFYLEVVEERDDGIVVSGAKAHTSHGAVCNELLVLPTRGLAPEEREYAVAFAVPADAEGLQFVCRPTNRSEVPAEEHPISGRRDETESVTVFDEVFVPRERVFLCGETGFAGDLVAAFATYHRFTGTVYKPPLVDLFVGAATLLAEANGLGDDRVVAEKITDMVTYVETTRALSKAAVYDCSFRNGQAIPDPAAVNAGKYYFASNYHRMVRHLQDVAGGLAVTLPQLSAFDDEDLAATLDRYLAGAEGWDGTSRAKLLALVRDLATSEFASWEEVLSVHAEGSLQAQRLALSHGYDTTDATDRVRAILNRMDP